MGQINGFNSGGKSSLLSVPANVCHRSKILDQQDRSKNAHRRRIKHNYRDIPGTIDALGGYTITNQPMMD